MSKSKRKRYSAQFKAKIALDAPPAKILKNGSELCQDVFRVILPEFHR